MPGIFSKWVKGVTSKGCRGYSVYFWGAYVSLTILKVHVCKPVWHWFKDIMMFVLSFTNYRISRKFNEVRDESVKDIWYI